MATEVTVHQPQHTFADLERMAKAIADSGLFGVTKPTQALSLMLLAQAEGLHPAIAARDYHIIEGRPALKADVMLARFQANGGIVEWLQLTDTIAEATFTAPGGKPLTMDWTIERANQAKLVRNNRDGSPGMWMKYPRSMLRSRLSSEAIRTVMPGIIAGVYTPEELRDEPELRDITPRGEKSEPESPRKAEEVIDVETGEINGAAQTAQAQQPPAAESRMSESARTDHLSAIDSAATLEDLKTAHSKAYAAAHKAGDGDALLKFEVAKNAQKYKLTKGGET